MKFFFSVVSCLIVFVSTAQKLSVNDVKKDPLQGKANEILYKVAEGQWIFQPYGGMAIKCTYRPLEYARGEFFSDAVIAKPEAIMTKIIAGPSQTIELENLIRIVVQRDKFYYKLNNDVKVKAASFFDKGEYKGFRFQLAPNEQIFGGGERALPMNRRGYRFNLYNNPRYGYGMGADNLNFSIPLLFSSAGYAIFFDNPSKGYMDIGLSEKNILEVGFISGELNYFIVFGKNLDEMVSNYTLLTGRQPLPPRWAFGNFVSRFGYRSEEQVTGVVKKMKEEKFPMDAVIFDLFWFGDSIKGTLGNLDWVNQTKWPNPAQMIGNLKNQNLKTILITEPFILNDTRTYNEALPHLAVDNDGKPFLLQDFYFGQGGLIDIFRQSSRDWIWKYYKRQMDNGVSGWWLDLTEPEKHPNDMYHNAQDLGVSRLLSADEVHNLYGHYWSKMLSERFNSEYPSMRLFLLNRAGFAGSQRYSVFPWTGDVARDWNGLRAQLPVLLGMSLSGLPYVHSDAGGFSMADKADAELYTRWLQFASFTPVFRPHGTALGDLDASIKSIPSEPAFWDDPHKSIVRKYINLRYEMLPYNYTLSYEQSVLGKPLMRTMYHYDFRDTAAMRAENQYMWGDHILVAPVVSPQQTVQQVYLPEGTWYRYADHTALPGKRWVEQPLSVDHIPVFVKGGSFIPTWKSSQPAMSTDSYNSQEVVIKYYPANRPSTYNWFDDDGHSPKTLEKADYEILTFMGNTINNRVEISISTNNLGNYKRKQTRNFSLAIPIKNDLPVDFKIDGKSLGSSAGSVFSDLFNNQFISFPIQFSGNPMKVEIQLR